ncbi:hypothetical protein GJ496_004419 [Pomphorhynchus laevis]|nr:hypothetical protein GJ496_004419 [Pomphorhynchus laevis]
MSPLRDIFLKFEKHDILVANLHLTLFRCSENDKLDVSVTPKYGNDAAVSIDLSANMSLSSKARLPPDQNFTIFVLSTLTLNLFSM